MFDLLPKTSILGTPTWIIGNSWSVAVGDGLKTLILNSTYQGWNVQRLERHRCNERISRQLVDRKAWRRRRKHQRDFQWLRWHERPTWAFPKSSSSWWYAHHLDASWRCIVPFAPRSCRIQGEWLPPTFWWYRLPKIQENGSWKNGGRNISFEIGEILSVIFGQSIGNWPEFCGRKDGGIC